jgi:hypothetical protein
MAPRSLHRRFCKYATTVCSADLQGPPWTGEPKGSHYIPIKTFFVRTTSGASRTSSTCVVVSPDLQQFERHIDHVAQAEL